MKTFASLKKKRENLHLFLFSHGRCSETDDTAKLVFLCLISRGIASGVRNRNYCLILSLSLQTFISETRNSAEQPKILILLNLEQWLEQLFLSLVIIFRFAKLLMEMTVVFCIYYQIAYGKGGHSFGFSPSSEPVMVLTECKRRPLTLSMDILLVGCYVY